MTHARPRLDDAAITGADAMQMWATFAVVGGAIVLFALAWGAVEIISLGVIIALLLLFHFSPLVGPSGLPAITADDILGGFANPALITILGLLVIGQALHQTGALEELSNRFVPQDRRRARADSPSGSPHPVWVSRTPAS